MLIPCSSTTSLRPGQELDGERIGERVREPSVRSTPTGVRPTHPERPAGGIGTRVAGVLGRGEYPLAQLR